MTIGDIPGVEPGAIFEDRRGLREAEVHRPTQAGIAGSEKIGAESIVLSGAYTDDEDLGEEIIYTGHGGQDTNGRQIEDQSLSRQNLALAKSCLKGLPVRVIRGSKHRSPYSPEEGYRYDGLYWVDRYWQAPSVDGPLIWRFRLVRDQALRGDLPTGDDPNNEAPADRVAATVLRLVRDTAISREVKELYDYRCQVCGHRLECRGGPYAEGAHIRPLGRPHNGPDTLSNILCLCPNHHVLFDNGAFTIAQDMSLDGIGGVLDVRQGHQVDPQHLEYHRRMWTAD